jgi:SAM-dependent methyltransferase
VSRLDSFIRRLEAQRACIDAAAESIAALKGPVLELGLGNGRTYDHLRERLVGREIFVFERQLAAHPACIPDSEHLFLGDIHETLPAAVARFEGRVALIHSDIGTGDAEANAVIASFLSDYLTRFLRPGGLIIADQPMTLAAADSLPLPEGVKPGRYFIYRRRP